MQGDALARGAKSQVFPSLSHISIDKWESIFGKRPLNVAKPEKNTSKNVSKRTSRKSSH